MVFLWNDKMIESDRKFIFVICFSLAIALIASSFAYTDFSSNCITSPELWIATALVAFFAFVITWFIAITIYIWTY